MARLLCLSFLLTAVCLGESAGARIPFEGPARLSFEELLQLAVEERPSPPLAHHLETLLSTPFISNEAALSGVRPIRPSSPALGPVLRVVEWNINRGIHAAEVEMSLSHSGRFEEIARRTGPDDPSDRIRRDRTLLHDADVIILDEVDDGMKRTEYRDVTRSLARALGFNYAYAVEFIELDRLYLGEKKLDAVAVKRAHDPNEVFGVDPKRYRGLEGNAILSRYPIRNARVVRLPQCYDWFHGEIQQISDLEKAKRWSAQKVFDESIHRQVRRGGRMALIADLDVPEAPGRRVTVVAPHLENYCPPQCRRQQMNYLLGQIKNLRGPVILGGDLNTTGHDQTPTSIRYEVLKRVFSYHFWTKEAVLWFTPIPLISLIDYPANYLKNYRDPTALDMRVLAPNQEKPLFKDARSFQFADGGSFDFAGQRTKTAGRKARTLAQSDQRSWKGFLPTFFFRRRYFHLVGSYKLDWFLVKPAGANPNRRRPLQFAPYYGRTFTEINRALGGSISDHCPIAVDMPLSPGP